MENNLNKFVNYLIENTFIKDFVLDERKFRLINSLDDLYEFTENEYILDFETYRAYNVDEIFEFDVKPLSIIIFYDPDYFLCEIDEDYNINIYDIMIDVETISLYEKVEKLDLQSSILYEKIKKGMYIENGK